VGDDFSGGTGSDTFVLAAGEGTDTILDFEIGVDFLELVDGLSFGQLAIAQEESNTLIRFNDETLAILNGITASTLTESAFTMI
jgi:glycerophosphoryl diester phosphodiesterase